MRPIDADALEKKLRDAIDVGKRADVSTAELEAVLADVENMPTLPGPALPESVKTFASCTSCIHRADSEDICILRRCVHAIAELKECYEPKERGAGHWKGYNMDKDGWKRTDGSPVFLICSECGGTVLNNGSAYWNFCPHCGARMEDCEGKDAE